jgi:hypothetical protein
VLATLKWNLFSYNQADDFAKQKFHFCFVNLLRKNYLAGSDK